MDILRENSKQSSVNTFYPGKGCGCGCTTGAGCGCGCTGGAGCGCN